MSAMRWLEHRIPPPLVGAIVALGMWAVAGSGPHFAIVPGLKYAVVGILVAGGIAVDGLAIMAFRTSRTTVNPLKPERASSMVTGGVYAITRNPMYLGMGLLLLAWAVWLSALLPFAGPVLYVLYLTRFQIQPEERVLRGLFGQEYVDYCGRVRRWL